MNMNAKKTVLVEKRGKGRIIHETITLDKKGFSAEKTTVSPKRSVRGQPTNVHAFFNNA